MLVAWASLQECVSEVVEVWGCDVLVGLLLLEKQGRSEDVLIEVECLCCEIGMSDLSFGFSQCEW